MPSIFYHHPHNDAADILFLPDDCDPLASLEIIETMRHGVNELAL